MPDDDDDDIGKLSPMPLFHWEPQAQPFELSEASDVIEDMKARVFGLKKAGSRRSAGGASNPSILFNDCQFQSTEQCDIFLLLLAFFPCRFKGFCSKNHVFLCLRLKINDIELCVP